VFLLSRTPTLHAALCLASAVVSRPGEDGVDELVELEVGAVAHGGHCVARLDGRVVFVRHALPGERVRARLTDASSHARFWRADAVEVVGSPSVDRVTARCPVSGPGGCGGCDWQHVSTAGQRALKAQVVAEQLRRLAAVDLDVLGGLRVEPVPGDEDGLGWRTRVRLAVGPGGRAGLRAHRSHRVLALVDCPLAAPALDLPAVLAGSWPPGSEVLVTGGGGDPRPPSVDLVRGASPGRARRVEQVEHVSGPSRREERAGGRTWPVSGLGFWQVHPAAADTLVAAVRAALQPGPGERLLDLYSGVGLFAGSLAPALAPGGSVVAVEADARAVRQARRALHDLPQVRLVTADVARWLAAQAEPVDLVVLDPPRRGAGVAVCEQVAARRPRTIAYVACDPAGLARDIAALARHGYGLTRLRAFDLFPLTHHVECVATLQRLASGEAAVVG
jgi:tRNA/tmRNA/rRNA uracil-C5-methylase (TrmA/RlmC/RlmD family)